MEGDRGRGLLDSGTDVLGEVDPVFKTSILAISRAGILDRGPPEQRCLSLCLSQKTINPERCRHLSYNANSTYVLEANSTYVLEANSIRVSYNANSTCVLQGQQYVCPTRPTVRMSYKANSTCVLQGQQYVCPTRPTVRVSYNPNSTWLCSFAERATTEP